MEFWSSIGMSFKTRLQRSNPKVETRCLAIHFRYMCELIPLRLECGSNTKSNSTTGRIKRHFQIGGNTPPLRLGPWPMLGVPWHPPLNDLESHAGQIALAWLLKKSPVILPIPG